MNQKKRLVIGKLNSVCKKTEFVKIELQIWKKNVKFYARMVTCTDRGEIITG